MSLTLLSARSGWDAREDQAPDASRRSRCVKRLRWAVSASHLYLSGCSKAFTRSG